MIVMRNRPEYLEALLAIWHAGLVAVPINSRLHRAEIEYIVDHSGAIAVITDDDHASDAEAVLQAVDTMTAVVVAPGPQWLDLASAPPIAAVDRRPTDQLQPDPSRPEPCRSRCGATAALGNAVRFRRQAPAKAVRA